MQAPEGLEERIHGSRHLQLLTENDPPKGDRVIVAETRLCHHCGLRTPFQLDPRGDWYQCLRCGLYD